MAYLRALMEAAGQSQPRADCTGLGIGVPSVQRVFLFADWSSRGGLRHQRIMEDSSRPTLTGCWPMLPIPATSPRACCAWWETTTSGNVSAMSRPSARTQTVHLGGHDPKLPRCAGDNRQGRAAQVGFAAPVLLHRSRPRHGYRHRGLGVS
jgi:hypothetical protein